MSDFNPLFPETVLFIGAGATVNMNIPPTDSIAAIISTLVGIEAGENGIKPSTLEERIEKAFEDTIHKNNKSALKDLLLLLYDGDNSENDGQARTLFKDHVKKLAERYQEEYELTDDQKDEMEWNLSHLHLKYDWAGVRSIAPYIARVWNSSKKERSHLKYVDLLTGVDLMTKAGMGMATDDIFTGDKEGKSNKYIVSGQRLDGIRNCLLYLTGAIQRLTLQEEPGYLNSDKLCDYKKFAEWFSGLVQDEAEKYIDQKYYNSRRFYLNSTAIVSFNWEPAIMWLLFNAQHKLNQEEKNFNGKSVRLYHDFGDGIGVRRLKGEKHDKDDMLAFMVSESICRRINGSRFADKQDNPLFRITKLMFPHGGLGWRVCPCCGKLFTILGRDIEDTTMARILGPDLLPEMNPSWTFGDLTDTEIMAWKKGHFGALQCVFCGSLTTIEDSPMILQSMVKSDRHYVLEGVQREMGITVGKARHLVFAGYSLPQDDVVYKSIFESAWGGREARQGAPYCTVINWDSEYPDTTWLKGDKLAEYMENPRASEAAKTTIQGMLELFGLDNIRVWLKGFPGVIADHPGKSPKEALIDMLYPEECFPDGFPPKR